MLAKDAQETGAFHGFVDLGDDFWDVMNDENGCEWPDFDVDCGTDAIGKDAFRLSRWGRLAIFPDEMRWDGQEWLDVTCRLDIFFENSPPVGDATYWAYSIFDLKVQYRPSFDSDM